MQIQRKPREGIKTSIRDSLRRHVKPVKALTMGGWLIFRRTLTYIVHDTWGSIAYKFTGMTNGVLEEFFCVCGEHHRRIEFVNTSRKLCDITLKTRKRDTDRDFEMQRELESADPAVAAAFERESGHIPHTPIEYKPLRGTVEDMEEAITLMIAEQRDLWREEVPRGRGLEGIQVRDVGAALVMRVPSSVAERRKEIKNN